MVSLHGARRARPALRCPTSTIYSHHPVLALEMARKKSREVYEKTSLQKGGESGLGAATAPMIAVCQLQTHARQQKGSAVSKVASDHSLRMRRGVSVRFCTI